jgi:hypothetical protein
VHFRSPLVFESGRKTGYALVMDEQPRQMVPYAEVRYVAMGQLTIYLVSEDELRMIEIGGPSSTFLNLAIFFLSVAASFFVSLFLSQPTSVYKFSAMVIVTTGCAIAGLVLSILWIRSSKGASNVIKQIRARGITEQVTVKRSGQL